MAINPATGLEDPNYTPPGDESGAALTGPEATVEPQPALEPGQVPQMDLELSDQDPTLQEGYDRMDQVLDKGLQDLEDYQGPDTPQYEGMDPEELKAGAGVEEGSSYITPEGTVAGQLEKLLDADSAYLQNAKRRADEKAASLGLLGSSMAVGASERAAIESALPIAQADAKTYATAMLAEQAAYNEISQKKAESDLSGAAREHIYDIDLAKTEATATFNQILENAKLQGNMAMETTMTQIKSQWEAETQAAIKNLDAQLTMQIEQQKISASERQYASQQASSIMASAYGTINELMGNADFMAGYKDNPEKLTDVFNNFINIAKNQVEFIGATAGLGDEYFQGGGYADLIGSWTTDMGGYVPTET